MADLLYLVKSNRVREYQHQNLAILAAAEGERFEISYGERWIQPGLEVTAGDGCALVIADSPYSHYQPLRWGVVHDVEFADKRLRLTVRVGAFILDGDALTAEWAAAAELDRQRGDSEKTRPYFAFVEPNHGLRNPHGRDEQEEAWHLAVDGLMENDYFKGCSVARVGEVTRSDGVAIDSDQPVAVGTELRIPIEVRSIERDLSRLEVALEAEPEGSIELIEQASVSSEGIAEVRAVLTAAGEVRARVNLLPDALRSSRPVVEFLVADAVSVTEDVETRATTTVDSVQRLVRRLRREAIISDADWIALFEDFFVPWGDGHVEVVATYAEMLFSAGRHRDVEALLVDVVLRSPRQDLLLLVASIHNGTAAEYLELLPRVDFEDAGHFALLLEGLGSGPSGVLRPVVEPLYREILGDDRKLELMLDVFERVESDDFATVLGEEIAYNDPERGVGLMMDRWPDPSTMHEPALELIVDFGVRRNRLGPYVNHWLATLAEARQWETLVEALPKARLALSASDRPATFGALALDLLSSGDHYVARSGFELVCESANEACVTGQLDTASGLADILRGNLSLGATEERRMAAEALLETIRQALEESDEVTDWRAKHAADRCDALVPHCRNKVLHLVGGRIDSWESDLPDDLELSKLVRHESEKGKSPTAEWVDSTDPDEDIVVILWERIGHALSGRIADACRKRNVTLIRSRTGQRALLDALEQEFHL